MFDDPNELAARLESIRAELTDLESVDQPTDEQVARAEELLGEWDAVKEKHDKAVARAAKIEAIRTAALNPANRTPGSEPDSRGGNRSRNIYDIGHLRSNPFALGDESVRNELVTRAYDAIEDLPARFGDDVREAATRMIENINGGDNARVDAALHVLTTGNPAWRSAFRKIIKNPSIVQFLDGEERDAARAAMSLTNANGGYLLPFELDPTIILNNAGTVNQVRQIARVVQTTQNVWHGVSSAGVTAEWTSEATEAADASPTFTQPTVTAYKGDAYLQATFEFLEDSNIENDIGMLIADAKDRLEATAFINGNGTSAPHGLVTVLSGVTASRVAATTNGSFGAVDVLALDTQLSPRWRNNASFLANKGIYNLVRLFATGTGALSGSFWVDFGGGLPPKLIGYNAYQASDMTASLSTATASNDDILILGDFRQYLIADRIGMSLVYEPLVKGASFRPTGQVGWYATWRTGADVLVNDAFRLLRV